MRLKSGSITGVKTVRCRVGEGLEHAGKVISANSDFKVSIELKTDLLNDYNFLINILSLLLVSIQSGLVDRVTGT